MTARQLREQEGAAAPPGFRDRWFRRNPVLALAYRVAVGVVGALVVVVGVALLALPGPGWVIIFGGLAILASEFAWARRLLDYSRARVRSWTHWLARQPVAVRLAVALATLALVLAIVLTYAAAVGLPGWLPDAVTAPVQDLVG